jgi:hypothetical protein
MTFSLVLSVQVKKRSEMGVVRAYAPLASRAELTLPGLESSSLSHSAQLPCNVARRPMHRNMESRHDNGHIVAQQSDSSCRNAAIARVSVIIFTDQARTVALTR